MLINTVGRLGWLNLEISVAYSGRYCTDFGAVCLILRSLGTNINVQQEAIVLPVGSLRKEDHWFVKIIPGFCCVKSKQVKKHHLPKW